MNIERRTEYLWTQIATHLALFFERSVAERVDRTKVVFGPLAELVLLRQSIVAIPNDIPYAISADDAYQIPFDGTFLTVWNRIAKPSGTDWQALPNDATPLWYVHKSGTHIPAWNLFGNLFALLTHEEERQIRTRDKHGRFIASYSPRHKTSVLGVPAFNEAVAALVAAVISLEQSTRATTTIRGLVKAPVVVLSHDCDILRGNDLWTQSIRMARIPLPVMKLRPPKLSNIWWIIRNYVRPRAYYFDNVIGMINLERQFGFSSTFYILNGTSGRFGARSGSSIIPELLSVIPDAWPVGMHYNYDTYLNPTQFAHQQKELTEFIGEEPRFGRAHYLRFNAEKSPEFLVSQRVQCDESAGFSDSIAYRCGIGGCFQYYDPVTDTAIDLWEVPMVIMEDTLQLQHGDKAIAEFERMLRHLGKVGGGLSVNVHPGVFFNPEIPRMLGFYHRLLCACRKCGAVGVPASALFAQIDRNRP